MRPESGASADASGDRIGGASLWLRWWGIVSAGELAGFTIPALVGLWTQGMGAARQVPALMAAGLVEGAVLGLAQALVLRRQIRGFRTGAWISATSGAAALAWLLGMLPSVTHGVWSEWAMGWVVASAATLGVLLLLSIGTAQAFVLPAGTPRAHAWVGWTALGWCAGLAAFSLVASPLWHEGQQRSVTLLIGVAAGTAMAVVMAAVTGVGVLHLCCHAAAGPDEGTRRRTLSSVLGTRVFAEDGESLGRVRDLVIDLAVGLDRPPVTSVLVGGHRQPRLAVPWSRLAPRPDGRGLVLVGAGPVGTDQPAPSAVLMRRDVLDCPVVLTDPPRRARVSDAVLDVDPAGAWVTELDVSTAGAIRRLLGSLTSSPAVPAPVRFSEVHLASSAGHTAQLTVPEAMVFRIGPGAMAEVLTRVSVSHARDILEVADHGVRGQALSLLHPHVRSRVTGVGPPPRRTRRLEGWRLHRPRGSGPDAGTGAGK